MYEKPRLNRVGEAQEVILGLILFGYDLDTTWVGASNECADDPEAAE